MKNSPTLRSAVTIPCLVAAALYMATQVDRAGAQDRKPEVQKEDVKPTFETVLKWLPPDTETLVVTKGPYQIVARAEEDNSARHLRQYLEGWSYLPLGNVREGSYL